MHTRIFYQDLLLIETPHEQWWTYWSWKQVKIRNQKICLLTCTNSTGRPLSFTWWRGEKWNCPLKKNRIVPSAAEAVGFLVRWWLSSLALTSAPASTSSRTISTRRYSMARWRGVILSMCDARSSRSAPAATKSCTTSNSLVRMAIWSADWRWGAVAIVWKASWIWRKETVLEPAQYRCVHGKNHRRVEILIEYIRKFRRAKKTQRNLLEWNCRHLR